jgi:hypothetical protein
MHQSANDNDRRNSARSRLFMLVRTKQPGTLWAWDIGLGGMQCKSSRMMWPGTYLDVEFTLPGTKEAVSAGAQVISIGTDADGTTTLAFRFCRLPDQGRLAIYRFLDRRRYLWENKKQRERRVHPELAKVMDRPEPFAELLREAYSSMRMKTLRAETTTMIRKSA